MDTPYITVTLEVSGYSDAVMTDLHTHLRDCLREWHPFLSYGELHIAYQDQDQIEDDATVTPAPEDAWAD